MSEEFVQDVEQPLILNRENYWQHYGLKADPFGSFKQTVPYIALSKWEQQLDLVQHLCRYSNVLLSITSVAGGGKSTFLEQCVAQIGDGMLVCKIDAMRELEPLELLQIIKRDFQLDEQPYLHQQQALSSQLQLLLSVFQKTGRDGVLLIDNAHLLPLSSLNILVQIVEFQATLSIKIHILLFAEPVLREKFETIIEDHRVDEDLIYDVALSPLTLEQTEQYLEYRLNFVGFHGDFPFNHRDIERIYNGQGIPGKINQLAGQFMYEKLMKRGRMSDEHGDEESNSILSFRLSYFVIGGILLLIAIASAVLLWPKKNFGEIFAKETSDKKVVTELSFAPKPTPTVAQPASVSAATVTTEQPLTTTNPTPISTPQSKPVPQIQVPEKPQFVAPEPAKVNKEENLLPVLDNDNKEQKESTKTIQHENQNKKMVHKPAKEKVVKKITEKHRQTTVTAATQARHKNNTYTIQLLGVSQEHKAKQFIAAHKLGAKARIIHSERDKKDWYVVMYGEYTNRQQAIAAAAKLPAELRNTTPWIRQKP